jgi:hypothetical protein
VQHALEPAFARLAPDARPEEVLDLKVCDPAMGSGAFLVEACRALSARLIEARSRHPEKKPVIPPDEDEELHARRLVAQRCLYGVDKNPLATDLAKLSLWLATLAPDHEFTFLDHALKSGDSLVGLMQAQIAAAHWDASKPGLPLFRRLIADRVAEAMKGRAEIQAAPDDTARAIQEARHKSLEARVTPIRTLGEAVIAAFFAEDKPKAREQKRAEVESWLTGAMEAAWDKLAPMAATLKQGAHPLTPFHWEIEFPEVFARKNGGFVAVVGNPPFAGGNTISAVSRPNYTRWLQNLHAGAPGNADLVSHFFRRAFGLLNVSGTFGLIATSRIGQGDTRDAGLAVVLEHGGVIHRAIRRLKWPGEAAVVVSVVHLGKAKAGAPILDGRPVRRISAYLVNGELDRSPAQLSANAKRAFQGSIVHGMGFTFDNEASAKGSACSLSDMERLIDNEARNGECIASLIGAEEINTNPRHEPHRYVINFADYPLRREPMSKSWSQMTERERHACLRIGIVAEDYPDPVAADWPELLKIVERLVKPERDHDNRKARRERWWRFGDRQPGLYAAIARQPRVVATGAAAVMHHMIAELPSSMVFSHKMIVFALATRSSFACLQATPHELWSRQFGTTFGSVDALTYNPTQVFLTFPFPQGFESLADLETIGSAYHDHRAALMIARNEGMTKTYNRFHDRSEAAEDIQRLRELRAAMDHAVLEAYGWHDLAARAEPIFLDDTNEDDHAYQGRLFWPSDLRDEVLARLLALNAERHAEEVRLGVAPRIKGKADTEDEEEPEE